VDDSALTLLAMSGPATVADYIASAPEGLQPKLRELNDIIHTAAPDAEERLSYGMPYFHLHGRLVYFTAHTHHIGMYPFSVDEARAAGLEQYAAAKGTLQFPLDQPLPLTAIRVLIEHRVARNEAQSQEPGRGKR
jgi:uncharacterized protein YdhG (YjbR/CyaY superfamily)